MTFHPRHPVAMLGTSTASPSCSALAVSGPGTGAGAQAGTWPQHRLAAGISCLVQGDAFDQLPSLCDAAGGPR